MPTWTPKPYAARSRDVVLLRNASIVGFDPPSLETADLLLRDGVIAARGRRLEAPDGGEVFEAEGLLVLPGLLAAWTGLTADPLGGLHAGGGAEGLRDIARAHTEETIICAAFSAGARALAAGTTCVVDVVDAPHFAGGALGRVRDVLLTLGVKCVIGYRVAGGAGREELEQTLEATREAARLGGAEQVRMAVAVGDPERHDDATLAELGAIAARHQTPILCEAGLEGGGNGDGGAGLVERLAAANLLGPATIVRVGAGIGAAARAAISARGATIVVCPRAELAAGRPIPELHGADALGTGAGAADVLGEARAAFDLARARGETVAPADIVRLLGGALKLQARLFGTTAGPLEPGAAADLSLVAYRPAMPLNGETLAHHLLFGFAGARVHGVVANGRFVVRDGRPVNVDLEQVLWQVQRGALDLWSRVASTPFPGWAPPQEEVAEEAGAEPVGAGVGAAEGEDEGWDEAAEDAHAAEAWDEALEQLDDVEAAARPAASDTGVGGALDEDATDGDGDRDRFGFLDDELIDDEEEQAGTRAGTGGADQAGSVVEGDEDDADDDYEDEDEDELDEESELLEDLDELGADEDEDEEDADEADDEADSDDDAGEEESEDGEDAEAGTRDGADEDHDEELISTWNEDGPHRAGHPHDELDEESGEDEDQEEDDDDDDLEKDLDDDELDEDDAEEDSDADDGELEDDDDLDEDEDDAAGGEETDAGNAGEARPARAGGPSRGEAPRGGGRDRRGGESRSGGGGRSEGGASRPDGGEQRGGSRRRGRGRNAGRGEGGGGGRGNGGGSSGGGGGRGNGGGGGGRGDGGSGRGRGTGGRGGGRDGGRGGRDSGRGGARDAGRGGGGREGGGGGRDSGRGGGRPGGSRGEGGSGSRGEGGRGEGGSGSRGEGGRGRDSY